MLLNFIEPSIIKAWQMVVEVVNVSWVETNGGEMH